MYKLTTIHQSIITFCIIHLFSKSIIMAIEERYNKWIEGARDGHKFTDYFATASLVKLISLFLKRKKISITFFYKFCFFFIF